MKDLNGRIAVVTGASMGIGEGIARALSAEGCTAVLIARGKPALDKVAESLRAQGCRAEVFPCDLSDRHAVAETFTAIAKDVGPVDILVNNAGAGTFKPLDRMTLDEAMLTVDLPFGAAVAATHCVVPSMIQRRTGHIVNLTSPAGYLPLPYMVPYAASRHAMVGLSLSLREELSQHNIGVTLLCPPQVNTGYFDRNDADMDWYPKLSKTFPVVEPADVGREAVNAIRKNKAEAIFPALLASSISVYRHSPAVSLQVMKRTGLFSPRRSR